METHGTLPEGWWLVLSTRTSACWWLLSSTKTSAHVADDYYHCLTSYIMIALALSGRSSMSLRWIELATTYKMVLSSPFNIGSILVKKKSTRSVAYMGRSFRGTQQAGREAVASKVHQLSEQKENTGGRRRWQQMTPSSMPKLRLKLWQPALRLKIQTPVWFAC